MEKSIFSVDISGDSFLCQHFLLSVTPGLTRDGEDVPIPDGGHGDHHPVEGRGDGGEPGVLLNLNEVGEAGKDEAADADQEDQEPEFLVAVLKRVGDSLETW